MKLLLIAVVSAVEIISTLVFVANFGTMNILESLSFRNQESQKLGISWTKLTGTTTITAFPDIFNSAIIALDNSKAEGATTTLNALTTTPNLATVGTITAGRWAGNAIQSSVGGTGTTSMSQFRVLLGNGTSSTTIATSTGSAGQVFTSNGAGASPSWQSITTDTAANYTWTGLHRFDSPLNASSTLLVNQKLSVSTSSPSQLFTITANGGALISGTSTFGSLIATGTLQVLGTATTTNLVISGTQTGGTWAYLGTTTAFTQTDGTQRDTTISSEANFALINYTITDGGTADRGVSIISRTGNVSGDVGSTIPVTNDGLYNFLWSGNTITIDEETDDNGDSSISGTIFWYR